MTTLVLSYNCRLTMSAVELRGGGGDNIAIAISSDSVFEGDRLKIHSSGLGELALFPLGSRITMRITNSVMEDVDVSFTTFDTQPPGTRIEFGFNTFVMRKPNLSIGCESNSGSAYRSTRFENNILLSLAPGATDVVTGNNCILTNNVLLPQTTLALGNFVMDPQFVDVENNNFRLRAGSPALGTALTAPIITSDHDYAGASRPQGFGPDIGAYEQ